MSHKATNWAITQRGLKPTSKLILWHLADCHNGHTSRCDPSQARMAYDCEISPSTLNEHLKILEERGLIRRVKRFNNDTKQQQTTFYILGFDMPDLQNAAPTDSGIRTRKADSGKQAKPTPEKAESRLRNPETNLGREPGIEPCAEPRKQIGFDDFWKNYPRLRNVLKTTQLFEDAIKSGVSPAWIIRSATSYAIEQGENDKKYIAYSDNWLEAERWQDYPEAQASTEKMDMVVFYADAVKEKKALARPSLISIGMAQEMLQRKLVTAIELKALGIYF